MAVQLWNLGVEGFAQGILACVLTVTAILIVNPWARRVGLVDRPRGRRLHADAVPLTGGIGIFLAFAGLLLTLGFHSQLFLSLLLPAGLLLLSGLLDDLLELGAFSKFALQIAAVLVAVALGDLRVDSVGDLFGQGPIALGAWSLPFTVFAVVGVINAVNMIDGMDGLAAFVVLAAAGWLGAVALVTGDSGTILMLLILAGGLAGFLLLNFRLPWGRQAAVFMGDSGSSVLGFLLAWFAIQLTQAPGIGLYPISAVWILALPVVDALAVMVRRGLGGRNPLRGGRDHVHHVLFGSGLCYGSTVGMLGLLCIAAGAVGVGGWLLGVSEAVLFGLLAGVLAIHVFLCELGLGASRRARLLPAARPAKATAREGPAVIES